MAEEVVKTTVVRKKVKKKKNRLLGFVMFLSIIAGIVLFLMFFPSCSFLDTMTKGFSTRYEFSNQYKATSSYVEHGYLDNVNINWRDGDVKVYTHDSDEISFIETPNQTVDEKFMMHYNYQETDKYGHSLLVQYCKSGNYKFGDLKKDLTVYIPNREDLHLVIHTYNSDIEFDLGNNHLSKLQVQSNHGNVDGIFDSADEVNIIGSSSKTVKSGYHYNIKQTGEVYTLRQTACQAMNLDLNKVNRLECGTVFSDLIVKVNECNTSKVSNSRGNTYLYLNEVKETKFDNGNIGKLYIYIKEESNYNIDIEMKELKGEESEHGKIYNEVATKVTDTNYKTGLGTNKINIKTSGNVYIEKIIEE